MNGSIVLKKNFRPIHYDTAIVLFNNITAQEYLLNEEQLELLLMLNGRFHRQQILEQYAPDAQNNVEEFLDGLYRLDALEEVNAGAVRQFPQEWVTPYLESILLDITSLCNLQCVHCYVSQYTHGNKGEDLTFPQVEKLIYDLASMNVRDVAITGGEPTLRKDIKDIILCVVGNNIRLGSFFTNGLQVDEQFAAFILGLPQFTRVYISLDGPTPELHEVIRGQSVRGSQVFFDAAIRAIRLFVESGVRVTVNTCLHSGNLIHLLEMYDLLKKLGVTQWRMAVPKPIGRYTEHAELRPSWDQVLAAYEKLLDVHLSEINITKEGFSTPLEVELEMLFRTEMVSDAVKRYRQDEVACFYHRNRCSIKANGDVTPCGYFDYIVAGNVKTYPIREIWLSERLQATKRIKLGEVTGCQECEMLEICGTGCRAIAHRLTGNMLEKDEYACAQVKSFNRLILPRLLTKHGFELTTTHHSGDFYA